MIHQRLQPLQSHRAHEPAGSLRHVRGFPALGLLRTLRPTPRPSADDAPSRPARSACGPGTGAMGWVPTFTSNRSAGEVPSYAPAASPRLRRSRSPWPPDRRHRTGPGVPRSVMRERVCAAIQPASTGWSWRIRLERRSAAGSSRTPSRLACRTRAVRSCRRVPSLSGLLATLPGVSRVGLSPASPGCCDSRAEKTLHLLSVAWRLVALHVSSPGRAVRLTAGGWACNAVSAEHASWGGCLICSFPAQVLLFLPGPPIGEAA
jgi:hypothetical protein